ncbi:MAG: amidohydrolase family protein [Acidimicrobiaceae bacterium]|nr:amidohydrolase family protein [Acidimicrobiaceae bacterium]MYL03039.1 amidohydrolase family protein [Acidimicrobiaceae bacterium]
MEDAADRRADLIIEGAYVVTLDPGRPVIVDGSVAVVGEAIAAVGPASEVAAVYPRAARRIDASGCLLMPGMIDTHTHLFQVLGRGLGDGLELMAWLRDFMFPMTLHMTSDDAAAAVRLSALMAVLAGTTAVVDNHYAPTDTATVLAVAEAVESTGLRGAIARGIFGSRVEGSDRMGVPDELHAYTAAEELEITGECIQERPAGSRVEVWPMPENVVYVDLDLIAACAQLAADHALRWQAHCSEAQAEVVIFTDVHGERPVEWLSRVGLLGPRATLAHAIWLDDGEVAAMGGAGACGLHLPVCNQVVSSGVMRLRELVDAGATVALGTDGLAVSGQSMFEAMKSAYALHRLSRMDPTWPPSETLLELVCTHGARVLGKPAGALTEGALADMVVVDTQTPRFVPGHRPVATLTLLGHGSDVRDVIVGGEVVVRRGRSTLLDQDEVMATAAEAAERLAGAAGLEPLRAAWIDR